MTDAHNALLVALGSLVVAFLVHVDARRGDAAVERRAIARERSAREGDAHERGIAAVVERYHTLRHTTGAGANWLTVRNAGIAGLPSNADVREALRRMALSGQDRLAQYPRLVRDERLDLKAIFTHSVENNVPFEVAVEAFRASEPERQIIPRDHGRPA